MPIARLMKILTPARQEEQLVTLDFSHCHFISAEAIAILAGIKLLRDYYGFQTNVDINTLDDNVKIVLKKSKLLEMFGHRGGRYTGNSLPIFVADRETHQSYKDSIIEYINQEIMERSEMPDMSFTLHKEIRKAFFELFNNIFNHSESPIGGLVCGQVYPKKKEIQIVFHDTGVGLAKRVRDNIPSVNSDSKAIMWALRKGTSTLSNNNEARGLGLYLLYKFIDVNQGELRICANKGIVNNRIASFNQYALDGTLIDVRIKVSDDDIYVLSSEKEE